MKVKKGDTVIIISGKDRGRRGKILKAFPRQERVVVEGMNLSKKHIKPRKGGEKGQIIEFSAPIHISNVKCICSKCGKPSRMGYKATENKKYRVCKKCGQET